MARPKRSTTPLSYSFLLIPSLVVLALAAASGSSSPVSIPYPYKSQELKYYVHLLFGDVSLATNFLTPLNTSLSANFGSGNLFAFNVTQGTSRTSRHLGFVRGFTVETSYLATESHGLEVAFIEYNDGHYNGTIQIQGRVQNSGTEVAIVGGTGSFRGARGFLSVSLVKVAEPYQLYSHELYFL